MSNYSEEVCLYQPSVETFENLKDDIEYTCVYNSSSSSSPSIEGFESMSEDGVCSYNPSVEGFSAVEDESVCVYNGSNHMIEGFSAVEDESVCVYNSDMIEGFQAKVNASKASTDKSTNSYKVYFIDNDSNSKCRNLVCNNSNLSAECLDETFQYNYNNVPVNQRDQYDTRGYRYVKTGKQEGCYTGNTPKFALFRDRDGTLQIAPPLGQYKDQCKISADACVGDKLGYVCSGTGMATNVDAIGNACSLDSSGNQKYYKVMKNGATNKAELAGSNQTEFNTYQNSKNQASADALKKAADAEAEIKKCDKTGAAGVCRLIKSAADKGIMTQYRNVYSTCCGSTETPDKCRADVLGCVSIHAYGSDWDYTKSNAINNGTDKHTFCGIRAQNSLANFNELERGNLINLTSEQKEDFMKRCRNAWDNETVAKTPIDCVYNNWVKSGDCRPNSTQLETRTKIPAQNGGRCTDEPLTRDVPCQYIPDINCSVSDWSQWGTCNQTSPGVFKQTRTRSIVTAKSGKGQDCPILYEDKACVIATAAPVTSAPTAAPTTAPVTSAPVTSATASATYYPYPLVNGDVCTVNASDSTYACRVGNGLGPGKSSTQTVWCSDWSKDIDVPDGCSNTGLTGKKLVELPNKTIKLLNSNIFLPYPLVNGTNCTVNASDSEYACRVGPGAGKSSTQTVWCDGWSKDVNVPDGCSQGSLKNKKLVERSDSKDITIVESDVYLPYPLENPINCTANAADSRYSCRKGSGAGKSSTQTVWCEKWNKDVDVPNGCSQGSLKGKKIKENAATKTLSLVNA